MAYRPARSGSEGNTRLLKSYGGSSSPPRQSYPQGYATGGAVKSGNPALAEGMAATSAKAPAKAGKSHGKGKGTNVNVIVVPGGKPGAAEAPPPMPMAGPPMPAPGPGPGVPPMPPEGMPMRKSGGRVAKDSDAKSDKKMIAAAVHKHERKDHPGTKMTKLAAGGRTKKADGGQIEIEQGDGVEMPYIVDEPSSRLGKFAAPDLVQVRSKGGPVKPVRGFDAGAGGGKGRLEKIKKYGA